jgi:hypothetical protein
LETIWFLKYHFNLPLCPTKKTNLKNHWLQRKEKKKEAEQLDAKIEQIANGVTKYISNRKAKNECL